MVQIGIRPIGVIPIGGGELVEIPPDLNNILPGQFLGREMFLDKNPDQVLTVYTDKDLQE